MINWRKARFVALGCCALALSLAAFGATAATSNTTPEPGKKATAYPTTTKVIYVLQCMEANGKSPEMLTRCSCGIDAIEAVLPFEAYEMAETGLQMVGVPGNRAAALRQTTTVIDSIDRLRKAQADSNLKCF